MVAVPEAVRVNVTEQLPPLNVQLAELKVPAAPDEVKLTLPAGVAVDDQIFDHFGGRI